MKDLLPEMYFLTRGVGVHRDKLASFEMALRKAGIERFNLVNVSSILPPHCRKTTKKDGLSLMSSGQIVFCVMARQDTNEPNRLISAAVGMALPADSHSYGYISEHHAYGETQKRSGDYAEDLAASMLATTLGIDFDPNTAWDERKEVYRASNQIFKTTHICQSTEGHKDGLWTTVVAAVVFLL